MEKDVIFIKLSNFTSKKTNDTYYQAEYLLLEDNDVTYCKDFIEKDLYELLLSSNLQFLTRYKASFTFDKFRRAKLEMLG